jgi:hypothetical protein
MILAAPGITHFQLPKPKIAILFAINSIGYMAELLSGYVLY